MSYVLIWSPYRESCEASQSPRLRAPAPVQPGPGKARRLRPRSDKVRLGAFPLSSQPIALSRPVRAKRCFALRALDEPTVPSYARFGSFRSASWGRSPNQEDLWGYPWRRCRETDWFLTPIHSDNQNQRGRGIPGTTDNVSRPFGASQNSSPG